MQRRDFFRPWRAGVLVLTLLALTSLLFSPLPAAAARILNMGIGDPETSEMGTLARRFKEVVETRSGGELRVELFFSCRLGDETEMIHNVRSGNLDLALVGIANIVPFVNKMGILTMPYIFDGMPDVVRATTGPAHALLNSYARSEGNFRVLGWAYTGFRHLSNSVRPVTKLGDLAGLRIRVPQSAVMVATYKAWNAIPVALSWNETFTALQQGLAQGQCYGFITFEVAKFSEVQKFITELHYTYQLQPLIVGNTVFDALPAPWQALLLEAGRDAQEFSLAFQLEENRNARARLAASGVRIDSLEDEVLWKQRALQHVWPAMTDFVGGPDAVNAFLRALGKKPLGAQ